ncbi:MAG: phosphate signaling complex protein PhoU [Anaerolineales bacterium]
MTRERLEKSIQELKEEVLVLGLMVKDNVLGAVEGLMQRDLEASRHIYNADRLVNEKRFSIEDECVTLIATQHPLARDLRIMAAILEIISELERMGDYAKGIARVSMRIGDMKLMTPSRHIPEMANIAAQMLDRAVRAFVQEDAEEARSIPDQDDKVDALFNRVQQELIEIMISDPSTVDQANDLQWVIHNLERLADRVTNICERTVYIATGEMLEMDVTDDELKFAWQD